MNTTIWPDNFTSAAMFTFDLDADTIWDNASLPLPNGDKYIKCRSLGKYGPRRSVPMILDLLDKYSVKATFFVPGLAAERFPDIVKTIDGAGHEIAHHGYAHELFASKSVEEQIIIVERTQNIFTDLIGHPVKGFRCPSGDWTIDTPLILFERGINYSSSMHGDDRPYRTMINGKPTDFIELPTKWELDDYVQMAYSMYPPRPVGQDRISCYREVSDNFLSEFEGASRFGLLVATMFHPQVIGTPGRMQILENLLRYTTEKKDVWIATGSEVADWYRKTNPLTKGNN